MIEEWVPVRGFEGAYEVSSMGRVRSLDRDVLYVEARRTYTRFHRGIYLSPGVRASGHRAVSLQDSERGAIQTYVHRLVAEAFIPNPDNLPFVLHWDDDPGNNRVENLRWGSRADNGRDAVRNGVNPQANKTHCIRNHPFDGSNTRYRNGRRWCRACGALKAREYKARKRAMLVTNAAEDAADKEEE